jgi:hypothetical protein
VEQSQVLLIGTAFLVLHGIVVAVGRCYASLECDDEIAEARRVYSQSKAQQGAPSATVKLDPKRTFRRVIGSLFVPWLFGVAFSVGDAAVELYSYQLLGPVWSGASTTKVGRNGIIRMLFNYFLVAVLMKVGFI